MKTDLDRLHQVVLYSGGRGCGKTFAVCHEVAGLFETVPPGSTIAWVLLSMNRIRHTIPMLERVLQEHELEFTHVNRNVIHCNGSTLQFVLQAPDIFGYDYYVEDKEGEIEPVYHRLTKKDPG